ncbi:MAG: glycosyl hydrolase [Flavobacteriaceae bacterium]|nr:glycosyl hydrolase [Flavobacteriaceae bacterium]
MPPITDASFVPDGKLVDAKATENTRHLYAKLQKIGTSGFAIGHQDATAYGVGWKYTDNRLVYWSDIKDVAGDYPAVYGFDVGHIELGHAYNLDTVSFTLMRDLIIKAHEKGGIVTISWHLDNPVSGGSSWQTTAAVTQILKGGSHRDKYELWVARLAAFLNGLEAFDGSKIPIVFRPFHEMNGSWFWWGGSHVSPSAYKALWVETLDLLMNKHNIHHLIYAYAPNTISDEHDFYKYYPGDRFVDVLGVDIYNHGGNENYLKNLKQNLTVLRQIATQKKKVFALTETGSNKPPTIDWWTKYLYPGVKDSGIAWLLLWRNAHTKHYFAPYPGESSAADFQIFRDYKDTLFLGDIKAILEQPISGSQKQ